MDGSTRYSPYTRLFVHSSKSIALSANGHIQIFDTVTGTILRSTVSNNDFQEKVKKSGSLLCADVDPTFSYLVTASSDKAIRVWEIENLTIVSEREAPKKPTDIHFSRNVRKVLVSDKFGDVHSYPLRTPEKKSEAPETSKSGKIKAIKANKRITDGTLVLGHVSLLTTFLLSQDEKYIITADRDEHIRISWFPEAYTIERFCLGHTKFVSALHIPSWDPSLLLSGGGDLTLKVWNWMDGKFLHEIRFSDEIMPYVKVVRKKPGRGYGGSDAEGEGEEGGKKLSARKRRKANKRKKKAGKNDNGQPADAQGEDEDEDAMELDRDGADEDVDAKERKESVNPELPPEPVLAIQKLLAFERASSKVLMFSAHGASALFYCTLPDISQPASSSLSPDIHSVDLAKPILDFVYRPDLTEVWVLVDGGWSAEGSFQREDTRLLRVMKFAGGELVEDKSANQALVDTLNTAARVETTSEEAENVDIYSALITLPKNLHIEHNAMDDEPLSEIPTEKDGRQPSSKELGRLKSKKAMLERTAALASKREKSETPAEERVTKRVKADDSRPTSEELPLTT